MKLILDFQTDFHKEFYMDKINRTVAKTGFFLRIIEMSGRIECCQDGSFIR